MMMCNSTKPKEVVVGAGGGTDSGTGPKCPRCGKTVYDAERAIGLNTVSHSQPLSVWLAVWWTVNLSISLTVSVSLCLSVCLPVRLAYCLHVCLTTCLFVSVNLCLSVCLSDHRCGKTTMLN